MNGRSELSGIVRCSPRSGTWPAGSLECLDHRARRADKLLVYAVFRMAVDQFRSPAFKILERSGQCRRSLGNAARALPQVHVFHRHGSGQSLYFIDGA